MVRVKGMITTLLLLSGASVCSATMTVNIPATTYKIARGDNVTIPCVFTPQPATATLTITWTAIPDIPGSPAISIATYFNPTTPIRVSKNYKGRASLLLDITKGKADLQLSSLTSKDTRVYECTVQSAEEEEENSPSATTRLVVLVAPTVPKCIIEGKTEYFQDITISCKSDEGTPTPTYKWQIFDVNNMPRPNPPKATDINGLLSLYNISKDSSGYYVCTSSNEIRSAKCNLTIAVMPPSMNMASTGGLIGAGVGALLLILIIIIICCCCRRRKNKNEEYAMGVPEGEEFTDRDDEKEEQVNYKEERPVKSADRRDPPDDRSERSYDRRSDYDDRRDRRDDHYDDRRDRYDDRRDQNGDRRDRYDDRRNRYDDRRDRNDDRQDRYDDRRDNYNDRRERDDRSDRYDDRRDRDDDRYNSDTYSEPYDGRGRPPSIPLKPKDPRN